uniref:Ig-like domain-containing protein n=1 Tax=Aquila chrysaetos chrysaetos TaxID=223781 RepID=A0A663F3R5_AQUCH
MMGSSFSMAASIQPGAATRNGKRSEVAVLEGSEARLACRQRGGGGPDLGAAVAWYDAKEREVTPGLAKYWLERGEAWVNLTIRDAEWPGDGGIYRCAAANAVGSASLPVRLRVDRESWEGWGGGPLGWAFGVAGPGAQEPIGVPEDAETAASRDDGAAAPAPEDPAAPGAAAGNGTHGARRRLSHPPQ